MTKFVKMSVAAAVAVAGLNSTLSAKTLEEAIQGVEVSGYVNYRKEYKTVDDKKTWDANEYNVNVTLVSKVNDTVSATVSAGFDEITTANDGGSTATASKDTTAPVSVDQAYFTFDLGSTTAMVGKQNIPSVFVDQIDTVAQGAGIVASYTMGEALTLAGAHFWNNNMATNVDLSELIVAGKASMISYAVNYNMWNEDTRTSVDVAGTFGPAKVEVRHSTADIDSGSTTYSPTVTKVVASAKFGAVKVGAAYGMTGEDNAAASLVTDNDAKAGFKSWLMSIEDQKEATGIIVNASMAITDKLDAKVQYANGTNDADTFDETETLVQANYKMSKNFALFGRYSVLSDGKNSAKDTTLSRIMATYKF